MSSKVLFLHYHAGAYHYGNGFFVYDTQASFPSPGNQLKENTLWETRIIEYNDDDRNIYLEVVDYQSSNWDKFHAQKPKTQLNWISFDPFELNEILPCLQIRNDAALANDVIGGKRLKHKINKNRIRRTAIDAESNDYYRNAAEDLDTPDFTDGLPLVSEIRKTIDFPIKRIIFGNGYGEFQITQTHYFGLVEPQSVRIDNSSIREEFQTIVNYLIKALGKKTVSVDILILKKGNGTYDVAQASSREFKKLDANIIQQAQYNSVWDGLKTYRRSHPEETSVPIEKFLGTGSSEEGQMVELAFLEQLLRDRPDVRFHELSYLAKRQSTKKELRLQFILQPQFAFLFILEQGGELVWVLETYKADLATYLWRFPIPSTEKGALKAWVQGKRNYLIKELATIASEGRNSYKADSPDSFDFVIHPVGERGFSIWREQFESIVPRI